MAGRIAVYTAVLVAVAVLVVAGPLSRLPGQGASESLRPGSLPVAAVQRSEAALLPAAPPDRAPAPGRDGNPVLPLSVLPVDRRFTADAHFAYILAAQRLSGAIAIAPGGEAINPYFANIAARALLLRADGHRSAVERWLDWYVAHLNADGSVDDYRVRGDQEQATGDYDSADSYAGTFLTLVAAYLDTGGDVQWVRSNRSALDRVAGLVVRLTDDDGLVWAKPYYPLKLLMDNAEVYQGWIDWARVLERLGEDAETVRVRERAAGIRDGLQRFRLDDGTYAWGLAPLGLRRGGNLRRFYPDAVAQFMPHTFGVTHDQSGWERFAAAYPDWTELQRDRFPWMLAAYAARQAGDQAGAQAALATAATRFADFHYPWYVAESAWALHLLERKA